MFSDHFKVRYSLSKRFRILFPYRQEWLSDKIPINPGELEGVTDGSKCGEGARVWGNLPKRTIYFPMGKHHSVVQTEDEVILWYADKNVPLEYKNKVQ